MYNLDQILYRLWIYRKVLYPIFITISYLYGSMYGYFYSGINIAMDKLLVI